MGDIFQGTADAGLFVETFFVDSWLEQPRQPDRVTNADRILQNEAIGW